MISISFSLPLLVLFSSFSLSFFPFRVALSSKSSWSLSQIVFILRLSASFPLLLASLLPSPQSFSTCLPSSPSVLLFLRIPSPHCLLISLFSHICQLQLLVLTFPSSPLFTSSTFPFSSPVLYIFPPPLPGSLPFPPFAPHLPFLSILPFSLLFTYSTFGLCFLLLRVHPPPLLIRFSLFHPQLKRLLVVCSDGKTDNGGGSGRTDSKENEQDYKGVCKRDSRG